MCALLFELARKPLHFAQLVWNPSLKLWRTPSIVTPQRRSNATRTLVTFLAIRAQIRNATQIHQRDCRICQKSTCECTLLSFKARER